MAKNETATAGMQETLGWRLEPRGREHAIAWLACLVRAGIRVRSLVRHPEVGPGINLALQFGVAFCSSGEYARRLQIHIVLRKIYSLLEKIEAKAPKETVPYQVENAAVARLHLAVLDLIQGDEAKALGNAERGLLSVGNALRIARMNGFADRDDLEQYERSLASDREVIQRLGEEGIDAINPGPDGPFGAFWSSPDWRPSWEVPAGIARDLSKVTNDDINHFVKISEDKSTIDDVLEAANFRFMVSPAESLTTFGRDIERAAAPFPEEFGKALREGIPVGEAVAALSAQIDAMHRPVVEALRGLLSRLHEVKSLGSYEENVRAAEEVYRIAKSCGADLIYDGEAVALGCVKRADYKDGAFRVRTLSGKPRTLLTSKTFPPLQLSV